MRSFVVALVLLLLAPTSFAQSAEVVDVDLVRAYLYMFRLTAARVEPGVVPDGMDPALIPPGVTVLGTLTATSQGTDIENEVVFARSDRSAYALFDSLYAAPPDAWTFRESGGHWMGDGLDIAFCSADGTQEARYSIVPDPEGGTFLAFGTDGTCLPEGTAEPIGSDDEAANVIGDGEIIDEPGDMEDVIGDGVIVDEPGDRVSRRPALPEIDLDEDIIQLTEGFGVDARSGERPGAYSAVYLRDHTVASAAAKANAAFQTDGWSHLGTHSADGTHVSVWLRTDEKGRQVIATLTVRERDVGVEIAITATR